MQKRSLKSKVETIVACIPRGRVMTYGQLASLAGNPRAARVVGGIAHLGNPKLPWHRVVNRRGGLASGYPGGRKAHRDHLSSEGIVVTGEAGNYCIDVNKLIWWPVDNPGTADEVAQ